MDFCGPDEARTWGFCGCAEMDGKINGILVWAKFSLLVQRAGVLVRGSHGWVDGFLCPFAAFDVH